MSAVCIIPNCGKTAPDSEAFCSDHRHLTGAEERPYAYCCAQGGGDPAMCDCVNPDHGTAWFKVRATGAAS